MTKVSKKDRVLAHLKKYGKITPAEAYEKYHTMRLASIICELRDEGLEIVTTYPPKGTRYAIYELIGEEETIW